MKLTREIMERYCELSNSEICDMFDVSIPTVSRARKKYGIKVKTGRPRQLSKITCKMCGRIFQPRTKKTMFCDMNCYTEYKNANVNEFPVSEKQKDTISRKAIERWKNPTEKMIAGVEKRKREDIAEFRRYRNRLAVLTKHQYELHENEINPNGFKRGLAGENGAYHLDHIISAKYGFDNDIPVEQLADKSNLRIIPWRDNILKSSKHYDDENGG